MNGRRTPLPLQRFTAGVKYIHKFRNIGRYSRRMFTDSGSRTPKPIFARLQILESRTRQPMNVTNPRRAPLWVRSLFGGDEPNSLVVR